MVADELLAAVVRVVLPPGARRQDVALLKAIGSIKAVIAPPVINSRVDVVLGELLVASQEEVVAVENVVRRSVRQRIGVENRQPEFIEPSLLERAGSDNSLRVGECRKLRAGKYRACTHPRGVDRTEKLNRNSSAANADISVAEIALQIRHRRRGQEIIIGFVKS